MAKEATKTENKVDQTPETAPAENTTKRKPPVRQPKHPGDATITLLADKDGNPFGKDNNPKRAGSASAARFANYVNGMTVDQALAAGITRPDLDFDVQKKFISISGGTVPAPKTEEPAKA